MNLAYLCSQRSFPFAFPCFLIKSPHESLLFPQLLSSEAPTVLIWKHIDPVHGSLYLKLHIYPETSFKWKICFLMREDSHHNFSVFPKDYSHEKTSLFSSPLHSYHSWSHIFLCCFLPSLLGKYSLSSCISPNEWGQFDPSCVLIVFLRWSLEWWSWIEWDTSLWTYFQS